MEECFRQEWAESSVALQLPITGGECCMLDNKVLDAADGDMSATSAATCLLHWRSNMIVMSRVLRLFLTLPFKVGHSQSSV